MKVKKIRKKGQFKIQQTAFMLLAITLFFILVGLFYFSIRMSSMQKASEELEKKRLSGLLTKLSSNPELKCNEGVMGLDCIDADKAMVLKGKTQYQELFGVSSLIIRKIYPAENLVGVIECSQGNYPNCNQIRVFGESSVSPISVYVALCRKERDSANLDYVYDKCEIGLLMADIKKISGDFA